jgi:GNAT superfamily N-acetyltransferase
MSLQDDALEPMGAQDMEEAAALVGRAMNADEGRWAARTMRFHLGCRQHNLDDGRMYYLWRQGGAIAGLVGLHHTIWGPEQNVWLAWFAVDPAWQGRGLGRRLMAAIEELAVAKGYRTLLVETYEHADFARARRFYEDSGFLEVGRIADYLHDGSAMIVYAKHIGRG